MTGFLDQNSELTVLSDCVCSGHNLRYECTVVGEGTTVWQGSAFICPSINEISLRHTKFKTQTAVGECNNGSIRGHGVSVIGNCYTSQLNVSVSSSLSGKTVECLYDDGLTTTTIGNHSIIITSGIQLLSMISIL